MTAKHILYHIPACPFSQRLEVLLTLRAQLDAVEFRGIDVTKPHDPAFLAMTGGSTRLPVLQTPDGGLLRESLVILDYFDEVLPGEAVRRSDPMEHAIEAMLICEEGQLTGAGYPFIVNQVAETRETHRENLLAVFRQIDAFLVEHSPDGTYLFDAFGLAETVFTPMLQRFWVLEYYEGFELPEEDAYHRVRRWRDACIAHPAAGQVCREEVVKLYYDYALGAGLGELVDGRAASTLAFTPSWQDRPWPPKDRHAPSVSDATLGLEVQS
ncbi:glutathione S-transferase family protein [Pseudophaeobacter sp.]|uniref:glutathione S-transferase family protein n=1 Tax=Pseudophaeobacter sp. TaxID=1971739 RepID=UPI003298E338